jgi:crossover junction endodeoxyribonuclease RuvC
MIVLGVDPGLYRLGYGIVHGQGDSFLALEAGVFNLPGKIGLSEKLALIYEYFTALTESYQPDAVCIEAPFVYKNARTAMRLGAVAAMFQLIAGQKRLEVLEISPKKVRSVLIGYGGASKDQVKRWVSAYVDEAKDVVKKEGVFDDTDAIAVAMSYFLF